MHAPGCRSRLTSRCVVTLTSKTAILFLSLRHYSSFTIICPREWDGLCGRGAACASSGLHGGFQKHMFGGPGGGGGEDNTALPEDLFLTHHKKPSSSEPTCALC